MACGPASHGVAQEENPRREPWGSGVREPVSPEGAKEEVEWYLSPRWG